MKFDPLYRNQIYKDRVKLITNLFDEDNGISGLKVINSECNVTWIVSQLLKELPSVEDQIICSNNYCEDVNKYNIYYPTIILNSEDLENISDLEKLMFLYIKERSCRQKSCNGTVSVKKNIKRPFIR